MNTARMKQIINLEKVIQLVKGLSICFLQIPDVNNNSPTEDKCSLGKHNRFTRKLNDAKSDSLGLNHDIAGLRHMQKKQDVYR
jgi:hypothetical protein